MLHQGIFHSTRVWWLETSFPTLESDGWNRSVDERPLINVAFAGRSSVEAWRKSMTYSLTIAIFSMCRLKTHTYQKGSCWSFKHCGRLWSFKRRLVQRPGTWPEPCMSLTTNLHQSIVHSQLWRSLPQWRADLFVPPESSVNQIVRICIHELLHLMQSIVYTFVEVQCSVLVGRWQAIARNGLLAAIRCDDREWMYERRYCLPYQDRQLAVMARATHGALLHVGTQFALGLN